jgi:BirA family transcriptional regulator, biotin operon repressor / biotin---[acetyl-CoA-carboxylase] ligase
VTDLPLSRALAPDLVWRAASASTNSDMVSRAAELADGAVLATDTQTQGRGRLDRSWSTAPGAALAVSVFVANPIAHPGWLPLMAGLAMTRAIRSLGVTAAGVKWPNDVLVGEKKLCGILAELTPHGAVIGCGVNLTQSADDLPVPTATSLLLEGVPDARGDSLTDRTLAAFLTQWQPLVARWRQMPDPTALKPEVEEVLHTRGRAVRVDRPGSPALLGTAEGLDADGLLLVRDRDGSLTAVAAGDVTHLRYE